MMSSPARAESRTALVARTRDQLPAPPAPCAPLEQAGSEVVTWDDRTQAGVEWFAEQQKARAVAQAKGLVVAAPLLGLHVAMGPDFPALSANLGRNLREGRVDIVQAVLQRR